jgi:hypothetical protein
LFFIALTNGVMEQNYTRLWVNKFAYTTASWHTNDMTTDAAGNAYLTGYFTKNGNEYYQTHLFLMKINAAGKQELKMPLNQRHF